MCPSVAENIATGREVVELAGSTTSGLNPPLGRGNIPSDAELGRQGVNMAKTHTIRRA